MDMKPIENIQSWMDGASSAQLLFRNDVLSAANICARKLLPGLQPGQTADQIFGGASTEYHLFSGKGTLLFSAELAGQSMNVRVSLWQDYYLTELTESTEAMSSSALRSVAESLMGPMTTVMSLTPKLLPQLEETSDPKNMDRAAQLNQGLYAMFRAVSNIRFAAGEGQLKPNLKRINITGWLRDLTQQLQALLNMAEKELTCNLPLNDYMCDIDPELLERGLLNILSNAMKYTEKGGQIRLSLSKMGSRVRITVQDNGCGIPAYQMGAVFDQKEHRAQIPDPRDGIGLGLGMSRRIMQAHSGTLLLESEEGKGTAVHLMLPVSQKKDLGLSTTIHRPDYSGGFNKLLLELADALPSRAFDTRDVDI